MVARGSKEGEALVEELNAKAAATGAATRAVFFKADISKVEQIEQMIAKAIEEFGRIDCLINNAGWCDDARLGLL